MYIVEKYFDLRMIVQQSQPTCVESAVLSSVLKLLQLATEAGFLFWPYLQCSSPYPSCDISMYANLYKVLQNIGKTTKVYHVAVLSCFAKLPLSCRVFFNLFICMKFIRIYGTIVYQSHGLICTHICGGWSIFMKVCIGDVMFAPIMNPYTFKCIIQ